jgi:hypothetical protein
MPERNVGQLPLYPSSRTSAEWNQVDVAVRNNSFFSACIEDERLLAALQKLVDIAIDEGWSVGGFIDEALIMLDGIAADPETKGDAIFEDDFKRLYDIERLRLIYLTQKKLSSGYSNFCEAFEPFQLQMYPAWEFRRQPGAREEYKRRDHVTHEGQIKLKTDLKFWLLRNREDIGGFGNPYGPWGFNSWMREIPVPRDKVEKMGLLKPGEKLTVPPEYSKWGIADALKQMGSAGVSDLSDEQQDNVIDRCKDEDISVTRTDDNHLQVTPDPNNKNEPLVQLEEATLEEWAQQEVERMLEDAMNEAERMINANLEALLREAEETM